VLEPSLSIRYIRRLRVDDFSRTLYDRTRQSLWLRSLCTKDAFRKECGIAELLCLVPEIPMPVGDIMLAQKFALELYELDVLGAANRFPAPARSRRHLGVDAA
jgi:hypothetical protein